jgi:MFS family permease
MRDELEQAQGALVQDAAWASLIGVLSGGVVLVGFALSLGAGPLTVGFLGAVPALGQLAQLPAIALVERLRRRRWLAVGLGVAERMVVLLLAGLPFLPDRQLALDLLLLGEILIASTAAMSACAWNSWMHDLLPRQGMGAFFARRLSWSTITSLAGGLAAGALVDHWPGEEPMHAYAAAFAAAAVAGFVSSWFLVHVPEPAMAPPSDAAPSLAALLRRPLRDPNFRRLILFLSSWSFSTNLAAPFITVYLLQQLGLGLGMVLVLWAFSQFANALTVGLWGRLSDQFSNRAVLRATTPAFLACMLALPLSSACSPPLMLALLIAIHLVLGVATGGTALASGNIALRLAPRGEGTAYMAAVGLGNAAAAGLAPILGGLLASWFAVRELSVTIAWTAPGGGLALTPLHLRHWEFFFILAAALGLHALHALSLVQEGEGAGGRVQVRDLVMEAARTVRSLSSVAGLRAAGAFPFGRLVGRPKGPGVSAGRERRRSEGRGWPGRLPSARRASPQSGTDVATPVPNSGVESSHHHADELVRMERSLYWRTTASKSRSRRKPKPSSRVTSKSPGQEQTISVMRCSGCWVTRARTAGPPTRSRLASISAGVTQMPGRFSVRQVPRRVPSSAIACTRLATTMSGDESHSRVSIGTGRFEGRPASGSRMIPLAKEEAAEFGFPGRTTMVGSRQTRPSTKPLRE